MAQPSISIQQTQYRVVSASLDIEQTQYRRSAPALSIQQTQLPTSAPGWDVQIFIDGVESSTRLFESVRIAAARHENRIAEFSLLPEPGPVSPSDWFGKPVEVFYIESSASYLLFSGKVDDAIYDPSNGLTAFTCSDNRKDLLNSRPRQYWKSRIGGFWSSYLFDDATVAEYAEDMLQTVCRSLDFNVNNDPVAYDWASGPADFTFTDADILDESLSLEQSSRSDLLNEVKLSVQYRYPRLRHRERSFYWELVDDWTDQVLNPVVMCTKDMLESAVYATDWQVKSLDIESVPGNGWYAGIAWLIDTTDNRHRYAQNASFTLATRFAQDITEEYQVTVRAPQSVAQVGAVTSERDYSLAVDYDTDGWEDIQSYQQPTGTLSNNGDYIRDITSNVGASRAEFSEYLKCVIGSADHDIKQSHFENYARIRTLIEPTAERHHSAHIDSDVEATGRVVEVEHELNTSTGAATTAWTLAVSRSSSTGTPTESPVTAPSAPDVSDGDNTPRTITLPTHIGNHPNAKPFSPSMLGYRTNRSYNLQITTDIGTLTPDAMYTISYKVATPEVSAFDRDERVVSKSVLRDIEIPLDTLVVTQP